ncbi:MAG TPA: hypothetical protein VJZ91_17570 [Blastocatellia bacterium]|nr:hypothetical protein [Blastocatellia bacterium]
MVYKAKPCNQPGGNMSQAIRRNQRPLISSGFARVSRRRPCAICGKPDWCVYTRDEQVSICMRVSTGAVRMNSQGGFIHIHSDGSSVSGLDAQQPVIDIKPPIDLAPVEVRDAVYSELIRLSPASNYDQELVSGPSGLLSRGFLQKEVSKFGALPPEMSERDRLSYKLHRFMRRHFPSFAPQRGDVPLIGIPGFWQEPDGRVRLWKRVNFDHPFLIIPYRDAEGRIQACQLRISGEDADKKKRYCWLSSAGEPQGVGTGDPLHFTFIERNCPSGSPRLITEGALKGEAFVSLRPRNLVIATSGVGNSRAQLIAATRRQDLLIGFDIDHRSNPTVCGQLAALIAEHTRDSETYRMANARTEVVVWDGPAKGIDDAALAGTPLNAITVTRWVETLEGDSLERVRDVWDRLEFNP